MRDDSINQVYFSNLDLNDPFFNSLRASYRDFDAWFLRKAELGERAFATFDEGNALVAMMYLKPEEGTDLDVTPPISGRRLKIGTLKVISTHPNMPVLFPSIHTHLSLASLGTLSNKKDQKTVVL